MYTSSSIGTPEPDEFVGVVERDERVACKVQLWVFVIE